MTRPWDWQVLGLPADPVPGDPVATRRLSQDLLSFAGDVDRSRRRLRGMADDAAVARWVGVSGDAFRAELAELPGDLDALFASYDGCGQAVGRYAPELERAQAQADDALSLGRLAQAEVAAQTLRLAGAFDWSDAARQVLSAASQLPSPDAAVVRAAVRDAQAARLRVEQLRHAGADAQQRLDAARRLALDAAQLREAAARRAETEVRQAGEAGIATPSFWHRLGATVRGSWDDIVRVAKVVTLVLGLVVLVVGGPLAWVVAAVAVVVLADTLSRYLTGRASLWDVALAGLDCVPGLKGLTTVGRLGELARSAQLLRAGRAAALGRLRSTASMLRSGAALAHRVMADLPVAFAGAAHRVRVRVGGSGLDAVAGSLQPLRQLPGQVPEALFEHVFSGSVVGRRLKGYHHRALGVDLPGRWIPRGAAVTRDEATGAYAVQPMGFAAPDGRRLATGRKTFFPDHWSQDRIRLTVQGAWRSAGSVRDPGRRSWRGVHDGFVVRGFYDPATGDCLTAFPALRREVGDR